MDNKNLTTAMSQSLLDDNINKISSDIINNLLSDGIQSLVNIKLPIIGSFIHISTSISDTFFMKKCLEFLKGINDIPKEKRYELISELSRRNQIDAGEMILSLLDKLDHPQKIKLICKLFKARAYDDITTENLIRLSFMIDKCPYIDLCYLKNFIQPNYIPGCTETLLASGFIEKSTFDFGDAEGNSNDKYSLTSIGELLLKYIE